jgi:NCS1 family nucleobase:cation symporter-1
MSSELADQDQGRAFQVESKGIEPIRVDERHGRPRSLFTLWFSGNVQFATLITGALATSLFGLQFWLGALAIAIGTVLGSSLVGLLSTRGPRTGLAQLIQARGPFGYFGNLPAAVFVVLNGLGWFAVDTVLGVFILRNLLHVSFLFALMIMVVVQVGIAIVGYSLIHAVERVLAVVLTVVFVIVSFYGFNTAHVSGEGHSPTPGVAGAFILTVAVTSARCLGFAMYASDYSRYLPQQTLPRRVFLAAFGGGALGGVWIGVLGAALGTATEITDPSSLVTGLLPKVFGIITLIALVCSTVASTVIDLYSGSMAALVMGVPIRRWISALVVGAVGTLVCWFAGQQDYAGKFQTFLQLTGYWIAPWSAVLMVDFWWLNRGAGLSLAQLYDRHHRGRGLLAVIVGLAAASPFMHQDLFTGPIASAHPGLGDLAYFVGFLVAGLVYRILGRPATPDLHDLEKAKTRANNPAEVS